MTYQEPFHISYEPVNATELARLLKEESASLDRYLGEDIYFNTDPGYLAKVRKRLAATAILHAEKVGDKPTVVMRAPGRLNAFLEYLDMCAGDHISTTIDGDLPICVSVRDDDIVRVFNQNDEFQDSEFSISREVNLLLSAPWEGKACEGLEDNWDNRTRAYPYYGHAQGDWLNYIRSSFLRAAWEAPEVALRGADITFGESTIPLRGGTSSSSAIVVLSFLALYLANADLLPQWGIRHICKLLGEAEWYVGTHGGANDQTTILRNKPNSVLYNRHSQPELDSTVLPSLKGVKMIVANSLWEASKSTGANHVFNLRKGWMDLGDDLMRLIISSVWAHLESGGSTEPEWLSRLIKERFGYTIDANQRMLEDETELWRTIRRNYYKFGSLDEGLLGIPILAIEQLISLLPAEISPLDAGRILGKDEHAMERDYTLPYPDEGGYRPRAAGTFFYKENRIGRALERIFIEADARLESGEIKIISKEYELYQISVGEMLDELQDSLRDDFQVSNSQLDLLLDIASRGSGYLGGKLTGAGCGGCVVIMVRDGSEEAFCEYLDRTYYNKSENFDLYREKISELSPEIADALRGNLDAALGNIESQRRAVTFSAGAGVVQVVEHQ